MRFSKLPLAMLTAAGMFFGSQSYGDEDPTREGLIRITDKQSSIQPVPDSGPNGTTTASATVVSGDCNNACSDECDEGCCCDALCNRAWVCGDYGYSRIQKYPIHRMPVQYYRYWPARWWGEPGSGIAPHAQRFPVIYTPTDTTQLGVYYQRAPQWLPNPSMLPPAPWPTQWHRRECAYNNGCNQCNGVTGVSSQSPSPTPAQPTPNSTEPAPPPPPSQPEVPPAPSKSAFNYNVQQSEF